MPFVDTVIWDDSGNLYAGGAFQNTRPPFEARWCGFRKVTGKTALNLVH